ncbi:MAG: sulfatase-like hydrolase/transferase [bacterium]
MSVGNCEKIIALLSIFITLFWFSSISGACGAALSPAAHSPNILLITIDTLRADHVRCYGYEAIKTPHIDDLARNGVLFTNAFSPVPLTLPSHASIMTGQYPIRHGIHNNGNFSLPEPANTLSEILQSNGYATGAIIASWVLASYCGLNQGFGSYDDNIGDNAGKMGKQHDQLSRTGEVITDLAEKWLLQNHKKPFFLWVHYFDPHFPYDAPAPFDTLYKNLPYDGEIAFTDQCLGHLFAKMQEQGIMDNTLIILAGDHGEGLWEHNEQGHGLFIYDTTLKVPLIMRYPKLFQRGKKVTSLVSTIDIMPTIVESLKIRSKETSIQGRSLVPLITGEKKTIRPILYCQSLYPQLNFNWSSLEGIITSDGWKYIQAPNPEIYNLKDDPEEKTNLYAKHLQKANHLQKELLSLKKDLSGKSDPLCTARQTVLSPETGEKLRALGYFSGVRNKAITQTGEQSASSLPDPKDMVQVLVQIDRAREFDATGQPDKAIKVYKEVISQDPNNIMAHHCLGLAYRSLGKPDMAVPEIRKVAEMDPEYYNCLDLLGTLYDQLAMPENAIQAYEQALEIDPSHAAIHNHLGIVYLKMNALDRAKEEFKKVLALQPDQVLSSLALASLGEIYTRRGDLEKAAEKFKRSLGFNPLNRDAHISLADIYFRLDNKEQSIYEWEKIVELWPDDYLSCYKTAQILLTVNKTDRALYYLRKCLQVRPDYIDARLLLQQISPHS